MVFLVIVLLFKSLLFGGSFSFLLVNVKGFDITNGHCSDKIFC